MKKFLIFYTQLDSPLTGGQFTDFIFIHQIEETNLFEVDYFLDKNMKSTSNIAYNLYLISHARKFLRYDVIFMNSRTYPRMLFFVLLLRIMSFKGKLITYHHHFNFETSHGWRKMVHKISELTFLKCMTEVIIPNPFVMDLSKELLPKTKTVYIPTSTKKIDSYIDIENREPRILCVGSIDRRKRTHQVVEIANLLRNEHPELRFDIVGGVAEKDYEEVILNMINTYNLSDVVKMHGRVDDDKLDSMYRSASLLLFPSSYEGYGMVLIEAMMRGLSVIAYDNSAIPYTVKDGYNGFLIEDNNYKAMAKTIGNVIINESILKQTRENALAYASTLPSLDDMRQEMRDYLGNL